MPSTEPTTPPTTPSTPVTTPSTPAASTPAGNETKTPDETKAPSGEDGDNDATKEDSNDLILWIIIGVIAAGSIAAVVVIFIKRKKA